MKLIGASLLLFGILVFAACGRKPAATPEDFKAAFQKSDAESLKAMTPEVSGLVDQAVTAMKKDDQMTAMVSLRSLRSSGQMTVDQALAVEDMMIKAQNVLHERADKGDPQAIAALEALKMNIR